MFTLNQKVSNYIIIHLVHISKVGTGFDLINHGENLKLTGFIKKIVFQLYKTSKSAITFDSVACSTHYLHY